MSFLIGELRPHAKVCGLLSSWNKRGSLTYLLIKSYVSRPKSFLVDMSDLGRSRNAKKMTFSSSITKNTPTQRDHRDLSNGANFTSNGHRMKKLFKFEVLASTTKKGDDDVVFILVMSSRNHDDINMFTC